MLVAPPVAASLCSISPIAAAYGRAARMASSARRMRAPATIFIARVICCVFSQRPDPVAKLAEGGHL